MATVYSSSQLWREVDHNAGQGDLVEFLDRMRQHLQAFKDRTFDALRLGPGQRVLDVGCGPGSDLLDLARRVLPGGSVVGVDASATMVAEANRRVAAAGLGETVTAQRADAAALPFADGSFSAARSERVLQHLYEPVAVLAEMARVVAPGGMVLATDPDWQSGFFTSGDPAVGRAVLDRLAASVQNPGLARHYGEILAGLGLVDVRLEASAGQHRFRTMEKRHHLGQHLAATVAAGEVGAEAARAWLQAQWRADAAGYGFLVLMDFTAWGRKA